MKRKPQLTKKERKAMAGPRPAQSGNAQHIHCIACGVHLDPREFEPPRSSATIVRCQHGSSFPSCTGCVTIAQQLLDDHDRTNQPVKTAAAWH
jgi:hypothetical protein